MSLKESVKTVNAGIDAKLKALNGGLLRIYSGGQPASAEDAVNPKKHKLLVELSWNNPAFQPAEGGMAISNSIAESESTASGNAAWFRALSADGKPVFDGAVAGKGSDAELNLSATSIVEGVIVKIDGFVYRQ